MFFYSIVGFTCGLLLVMPGKFLNITVWYSVNYRKMSSVNDHLFQTFETTSEILNDTFLFGLLRPFWF